MSVEEILAALQAIIDGAGDRALTDEEMQRYEALERDLAVARRNVEIRARQQAYTTPVRNDLHVHVAGSNRERGETLERAFEHFLRTGKENQDIVELRAQSTTTTEGGYTIPDGFRQKLVEVQKAYGGFAAEADNFTTESGNSIDYPTNDDTANEGDITSEGSQFAAGDDLVFGTVTLGAYKYTSLGTGQDPLRVSVELLQDSAFDIAGFISRALGTRIARKQARDWINGTGTTMPVGVLNDTTITPDASLDTPGTLAYADLIDLEGLLDPAYEQNAQWLMNKATWVTVRKILDQDLRPLIIDSAASGMRTQPEKTLFGYRVVLDQMSPSASGGTGRNFIGFGDWREAYVIRQVRDVQVVVDPYTRANFGQVQYTAWARADGNVQNRSAYKVLRG